MKTMAEQIKDAGLGATRTAAAIAHLADVPDSMQKTYVQAVTGKGPPRVAIKAFCCECMGYSRAEIPECTSWACPLYESRPYQKGTEWPGRAVLAARSDDLAEFAPEADKKI